MDGQVEELTTTVKQIASLAILMMLRLIISQVNVRAATILVLDGKMHPSTMLVLLIVFLVMLRIHLQTTTQGNVPIAMIPAVGGIIHILIITD